VVVGAAGVGFAGVGAAGVAAGGVDGVIAAAGIVAVSLEELLAPQPLSAATSNIKAS
jgi:hypothetical protein